MVPTSEPFASIDGVEGVGIRASSADSEVNFAELQTGASVNFAFCEGIAVLSASELGPLSAGDSGRYNGSRPFFLAKVCLIPPFSP